MHAVLFQHFGQRRIALIDASQLAVGAVPSHLLEWRCGKMSLSRPCFVECVLHSFMSAEALRRRRRPSTLWFAVFCQCTLESVFLMVCFTKVCPRLVIAWWSCVRSDVHKAPTSGVQPLADPLCRTEKNAIMSTLVTRFMAYAHGEGRDNVAGAPRWSRTACVANHRCCCICQERAVTRRLWRRSTYARGVLVKRNGVHN